MLDIVVIAQLSFGVSGLTVVIRGIVTIFEVPCIFPSSDLRDKRRRHAVDIVPVNSTEKWMGLDIGCIVGINVMTLVVLIGPVGLIEETL